MLAREEPPTHTPMTVAPGPRRGGLRPAEIVLLAFMAYCLVRVLFLGAAPLRAPSAVPRGDLALAMILVLSVRLGLDYRATPWPKEMASQKRLHSVLLVAFLCAGIVPVIMAFRMPEYAPDVSSQGGGPIAELVLLVYAYARILGSFLLPGAFFWFASGLYVKRTGRFSVAGLLVEGAPGAIDVLRDWAPPFALVYVYVALGPILNQRLFPDRDAYLAAADRVLFFGHDPTKLCEAIIVAPLSEWLSACYVFYGPLYAIVLGTLFAKRARAPFRECAFALSTVLAVGYVGYAFVPAIGPVFFETYDKSLDLFYTGWLKEQLMDRIRVPRDCFPSLHTAASLTLLWGAWRHAPRLGRWLCPVVISIPIACVYLRYHYATDVLAGVALCAVVCFLTARSKVLAEAFRA